VFSIYLPEKPERRRGYLSMLHSVYDPMGSVAPLLLQGKILLRDVITSGADWDDVLDPFYVEKWQLWKDSLLILESLKIPRMFFSRFHNQGGQYRTSHVSHETCSSLMLPNKSLPLWLTYAAYRINKIRFRLFLER
jgi:hypothetical protein